MGQFATSIALAREIAEYASTLCGQDGDPVRFFEPALGSGAFYSAIRQVLREERLEQSLGIEIDPEFADAAHHLWGRTGLEILLGDFTDQTPPPAGERFNLVIANPPYVRHHHMDQVRKQRLQRKASAIAGCDVSGLSGLYCYFLLLCHEWMSERGLGIWLIPSEFMDVNYGSAVRKYLTTRVTLLHIHRYQPSDVQFEDALVSSVVVVFRNVAPPKDHLPRFSYGGSLLFPDSETTATLHELSRSHKWTQFAAGDSHGWQAADDCTTTLGDLFDIKRGIATGANSFFIMPRESAREYGIPDEFLRPVLPSPRRLADTVVESDADGYPAIAQPLAIIDSSCPEAIIQARFPEFWQYLQRGKERGIHETYLASRRSPWYSQEQRPAAPFACTYMGRVTEGRNAFRFIWNKSKATAPNVYLLLYPKGYLRAVLVRNPELHHGVWEALQSIDVRALVRAGRVYGGGLHKLEPKELSQVSAQAILEAVGAGSLSAVGGAQLALFG